MRPRQHTMLTSAMPVIQRPGPIKMEPVPVWMADIIRGAQPPKIVMPRL